MPRKISESCETCVLCNLAHVHENYVCTFCHIGRKDSTANFGYILGVSMSSGKNKGTQGDVYNRALLLIMVLQTLTCLWRYHISVWFHTFNNFSFVTSPKAESKFLIKTNTTKCKSNLFMILSQNGRGKTGGQGRKDLSEDWHHGLEHKAFSVIWFCFLNVFIDVFPAYGS